MVGDPLRALAVIDTGTSMLCVPDEYFEMLA